MQLKNFIEFVNNKKEIKSSDISNIKNVISNYPFFETAYNLYLQGLKKTNNSNFENELTRYSIFINDRKKIYNVLFVTPETKKNKSIIERRKKEIDKKKIEETKKVEKQTLIKKRTKPQEEDKFDPQFYEEQKKSHDKIIIDFVVPKAKKFGQLSNILKENNIKHEDLVSKIVSYSDDTDINKIINEVSQEKIETKSDEVKVVSETKKTDKHEKQKTETDKKITEIIVDEEKNKKQEELIVVPEIKKEEVITETEKNDEQIEISNKKIDVVDDVFNKIKKLKADRLKASQVFEVKKDDLEKVVNEKAELNEISEEKIEVEKVELNEITEEKIEVEKSAADKILEKLKLGHIAKKESTKTPEDFVKATNESSANKILEKLQNDSKVEESTLGFDVNKILNKKEIEIEKNEEEKTEQIDLTEKDTINIKEEEKKEPEKQDNVDFEIEKNEEEKIEQIDLTEKAEDIISVKEEEKIELEKYDNVEFEVEKNEEEIIDLTEKEEEINTENEIIDQIDEVPENVAVIEKNDEIKDSKKSAADLILERIANRKTETKSTELINEFLINEPSLDRKKEPNSTQDLSKESIKDPEIVTERIAEIYTLQGLDDKAIKTYDKLILKFPEKKTLFANKIKEIKNKN